MRTEEGAGGGGGGLPVPLIPLLQPFLHSLPPVTNLLLQHARSHRTMLDTCVINLLRPLLDRRMLLREPGDPLLVLVHQAPDILHRDGQERRRSDGADGKRGRGAQEQAAVPREDRAAHARDHDVDAAGEQPLAAFGCRRERVDGVGDARFGVQGAGEHVIDAVLGVK